MRRQPDPNRFTVRGQKKAASRKGNGRKSLKNLSGRQDQQLQEPQDELSFCMPESTKP